jgi:hypothetical protein
MVGDAGCGMTFTFDQAQAYFAYRLSDNKVPHRGSFTARCPFHGDRTASLSVNLDKGGVWNCHACNIGGGVYDFESQMFPTRSNEERWASIYKITGATPSKPGNFLPKGPVVATYEYVAPDGTLLFEKQRHEPKCFTQRTPNGSGGWRYSLDGVRKVLYRLPEVMAAQVIFVAEGEKDVEALRALALEVKGYKIAATCNFDGAGKWKDEYSVFFAGKRVVIFEDNDEPGRLHAQMVAKSAFAYAEAVKIVSLDASEVEAFLLRLGRRTPCRPVVVLPAIHLLGIWRPEDPVLVIPIPERESPPNSRTAHM